MRLIRSGSLCFWMKEKSNPPASRGSMKLLLCKKQFVSNDWCWFLIPFSSHVPNQADGGRRGPHLHQAGGRDSLERSAQYTDAHMHHVLTRSRRGTVLCFCAVAGETIQTPLRKAHGGFRGFLLWDDRLSLYRTESTEWKNVILLFHASPTPLAGLACYMRVRKKKLSNRVNQRSIITITLELFLYFLRVAGHSVALIDLMLINIVLWSMSQ